MVARSLETEDLGSGGTAGQARRCATVTTIGAGKTGEPSTASSALSGLSGGPLTHCRKCGGISSESVLNGTYVTATPTPVNTRTSAHALLTVMLRLLELPGHRELALVAEKSEVNPIRAGATC